MSINRILVFKPGANRDFLHMLPALRALRNKFPAPSVFVMISPGQERPLQGTTAADSVGRVTA